MKIKVTKGKLAGYEGKILGKNLFGGFDCEVYVPLAKGLNKNIINIVLTEKEFERCLNG